MLARISSESDMAFFRHLSEWAGTPQALLDFKNIIKRPLSGVPQEFHHRLYCNMIDTLLDWLEIPRSKTAMEWELRQLYRLDLEFDPHYFTEDSILKLMENWPAIEPAKRQTITRVLIGYFGLRRREFPLCYPSPLISNSEIDQWMHIFPEAMAECSLRILRQVGLATIANPSGIRAYVRYTDGVFAPVIHRRAIVRWRNVCAEAGPLFGTEFDEFEAAHRANFVAIIFAGRFAVFRKDGMCDDVPECSRCPVSGECVWYNAPAGQATDPNEVLALVRRGHEEGLSTGQLLQGLFDLSADEGRSLQQKQAGTPLRKLATLSMPELTNWIGNLNVPMEKLRLLVEISRRFNEERLAPGTKVGTGWDVYKHFRMRLADLKQERFITVLLDSKRQYMADYVITQGTLDASLVHPREVFKAALRESAHSILIVHNHPSGDPSPSQADLETTRHLVKVGETLGIPLIDHVVIGSDSYVSLMEMGYLQ